MPPAEFWGKVGSVAGWAVLWYRFVKAGKDAIVAFSPLVFWSFTLSVSDPSSSSILFQSFL